LIATLSLSRIGIFDPKYHVPVVGGREDNLPGITTPIELFGKKDVDFVVIQQRSPVLKAQKEKFVSALLEFAKEVGFKAILFVSGVDATNRTDSQMHIPLYHLLPNSSTSLDQSTIKLLTALPRYSTPFSNDKLPNLPGAGLTKRILTSIPEEWIIQSGTLIWMGMEGDNREDAGMVAAVIAKILSVDGIIKEWKEPESWKQGLFGTPNDSTLFG